MSKKKQPPATAAYIAAAEYADDTLPPALLAAANALRDAARAVWLASDEERNWRVGGDAWGGDEAVLPSAVCPSDIAERLADDCRFYGEWDRIKTQWINDWATPIDPVTDEPIEGERVDVTTTIDPEEPDCTGDGHDWQSPHDIVGGCEENAGVHGHGGGVIITEVCAHCGRYRTTDTWAQNRDTGEQGLTSVEYADADGKSEQWIADRRDAEMIEACPYDVDASDRYSCGIYYFDVPVTSDADDEPLDEIRAAIGKKWAVEWHAECETNSEGDRIRNVEIQWSGS